MPYSLSFFFLINSTWWNSFEISDRDIDEASEKRFYRNEIEYLEEGCLIDTVYLTPNKKVFKNPYNKSNFRSLIS